MLYLILLFKNLFLAYFLGNVFTLIPYTVVAELDGLKNSVNFVFHCYSKICPPSCCSFINQCEIKINKNLANFNDNNI